MKAARSRTDESTGERADVRSPFAGCFFARFHPSPCRWRFDGQPDPAHLIPQQRLKAAGVTDLWDERLVVPACRHHHDLVDRKLLRLSLADYPPKLLAFAQQEGFAFVDERTGWVSQNGVGAR